MKGIMFFGSVDQTRHFKHTTRFLECLDYRR